MISPFLRFTSYKRAIAALLMLALIFNAILAVHYHLYHDVEVVTVDTTSHSHAVDLHSIVDAAHADHQLDTHTVESAEFARMKAYASLIAQFALFFCLSLLLPTSVRRACLHNARDNFRLPFLYWRNTPPLRAPPGA